MSLPFPAQNGEQVVPRRVAHGERLKRRRRIGLVVLIGLALTVGVAGKALAWTAGVQPSTDCKGTTFNGTVGDEPGSHTASVSFGGETKSVTVSAEGGNSFTLHFNSHDGGPWSYTGTWSESSEVETASGTLQAVTDCEEEQTPPPPTTIKHPEKPKPVFHGTATDKKRTPPAVHRREPNPDDSITVTKKKKETPGTLPFTGAGEQAAMLALGLGLVGAGAMGLRLIPKGVQR